MSKLTEFLTDMRDDPIGTARSISNSAHMAPIHASVRSEVKFLQDNLIPAFPDSMRSGQEPGAALNPTSQMVTQEVTGQNVDAAKDTLGELKAPPTPEPQKDAGIDMDR